MAEIVNLRREKRRRAKAAAAEAAAIVRAAHGRTKAEQVAEARAAALRESVLDGARLERDSEPSE